ncbi:hypothetical protein, variant 2 [Verruconis gallopava]|uniref:Copper-fist domain-containing protein n=1 Tax=Verruconis gallopava TaxID=253628 RepID=A0A0D2AWU2_9PEZI|nr:uncharacterized protein PV09_05386 [Verruconis gallopava]XP_016213504.1 hypothetical protein, variant 1 [Verruconis gallopava]XP_016213505.1 hypothetical protein, variant 2 [Verruconis gallopava]KIW03634.1 hypothetical protein PV09_05386 [Verruconis gallopava]KIW03635.1 hypothetical protein, variant 1 [Verruconis gallopava]KIW03636.1 hypothetical protein, variant 2 [Verruconis gallopava]
MPVIEINGEKKKVACGPCIRGHRSSKCTHSDRVLIEVRKPGRPLSACPHPSGSCGCQRAVFYTVPKGESISTHAGSLSSSTSAYNSPAPASSNRVQKPKLRKNSTSVNTSNVQRAFEVDPSVLSQHANHSVDSASTTEVSESSSNVPSIASSTSSTPQTEAIDTSIQKPSTRTIPSEGGDPSAQRRPLQLGMLGVGGFGTTSDELGWSGPWPAYSSIPQRDDNISNTPTSGSCCGGNKKGLDPILTDSGGACCSSKENPSLSRHMPSSDQPFTLNTNQIDGHAPLQANSCYPRQFSLPGPAFETHVFASNVFTEDRFGCPHQANHACECGEGCECLGCSMHPANRTTTDYVRYHTELAMRGYIDSSRMHIAPTLDFAQASQHFGNTSTVTHEQSIDKDQVPTHNQFLAHAVQSYLPQWQHAQNGLATPTFEMSQFSLQQENSAAMSPLTMQQSHSHHPLQSSMNARELQRSTHTHQLSLHEIHANDHESPSTEDDTSTLSPSAFSVQQFSIPGCNDVTGSCLCGDGCQCDGCLTHNGHGNATTDDVTGEKGEHGTISVNYTSANGSKGSEFVHRTFDDILRDPTFASTATS